MNVYPLIHHASVRCTSNLQRSLRATGSLAELVTKHDDAVERAAKVGGRLKAIDSCMSELETDVHCRVTILSLSYRSIRPKSLEA